MKHKDVLVGARFVRGDGVETDFGDEDAGVSIEVHWIKIGDHFIEPREAVIGVDHHADNSFHKVSVTFFCRKYEVVDHRDERGPV